ncbi:hypothetical protein H4O18_18665 [Arenibacter sp. BSSL-BM3]|uniref:Uncharacterized protein n=1 Tax=Arenibacter arenosicollis TaxID=2762274 RepID=A0ABR7QSH9_9FLAO|nr:hypothetical protein [Arenibacter arenosicollis]MBC8770029.1 hypothetical protein [Arenibacter arenosicollis]
MILETSHKNKDISLLINDVVGKPFSFIKTIKMKGCTSKKMIIEDSSPNLKAYQNRAIDATFANIELRPLGILIRIIKGLSNFTWVIPYYQLVIYKSNSNHIYSQGRFIRFGVDKNFKENKDFFDKLFIQKANYKAKYDFLNFK